MIEEIELTPEQAEQLIELVEAFDSLLKEHGPGYHVSLGLFAHFYATLYNNVVYNMQGMSAEDCRHDIWSNLTRRLNIVDKMQEDK